MRISFKVVYFFMAVIGLAACTSTSNDIAKQLHSSYDNDGQEVELFGYLALSNLELIKNGKLTLGLDNMAGQSTGSLVATMEVDFGQVANQVYMPEKFKFSDLEIYDNMGKKHGYLTEIKITGTVKYTNKNWKESVDRKNSGGIAASLAAKSKKRAQEAADKREKETGDPNDYSFYIKVNKIEIPQ